MNYPRLSAWELGLVAFLCVAMLMLWLVAQDASAAEPQSAPRWALSIDAQDTSWVREARSIGTVASARLVGEAAQASSHRDFFQQWDELTRSCCGFRDGAPGALFIISFGPGAQHNADSHAFSFAHIIPDTNGWKAPEVR